MVVVLVVAMVMCVGRSDEAFRNPRQAMLVQLVYVYA